MTPFPTGFVFSLPYFSTLLHIIMYILYPLLLFFVAFPAFLLLSG